MKTIQVKPWGEGQGDYVEINESDFDPDFHELYGDKKPTAKEVRAAKLLDSTKVELTAQGITFSETATQEEPQALLPATE